MMHIRIARDVVRQHALIYQELHASVMSMKCNTIHVQIQR
jgi:hypothetical protein